MTTETVILDDFVACSTAEQYLDLLGVDYDPKVVAVKRLHILKHFAAAVGVIDTMRGPLAAETDPGDRLDAYREALVDAYAAFVERGALDHRLFKVLRDHAPGAFVPVSAVTVIRRETNR